MPVEAAFFTKKHLAERSLHVPLLASQRLLDLHRDEHKTRAANFLGTSRALGCFVASTIVQHITNNGAKKHIDNGIL